MGEEEEEVTQEAIGTRLWNPRGRLCPPGCSTRPALLLACSAMLRGCWSALWESTGNLVLGPHCTRGAGHQLCTQKPDIGWRDGSAGQGAG